jgi:hypothetical protein
MMMATLTIENGLSWLKFHTHGRVREACSVLKSSNVNVHQLDYATQHFIIVYAWESISFSLTLQRGEGVSFIVCLPKS